MGGELDVRTAYPQWDPHKHYLVTVLTYLKKIFYVKNFGEDAVANKEARDLWKNNPSEYKKRVQSCVDESQRSVFVNDPGCTTKFTEDNVCHQFLREEMNKHVKDPSSLSRSMILDMVNESRSKKQVTYA